MDKFLEKYSLPRLNQNEIEKMNGWITSMETDSVIKKLPTNKSPGLDGFTGEFYQAFREELTPLLLKLFEKKLQRKGYSQTHSMRPPSPWYQNQTKIPHTHKKNNNNQKKKKKLQANVTDEHRCKNPQKILANCIQQYFKRIVHHDQVGFIPGFFNSCKSISVIHHINRLKNKNHMILSTEEEKAFDKIQHPFLIKTLQKVGIEGTYINIIKAIYDKPTANIILNGEKLKEFLLRSRLR